MTRILVSVAALLIFFSGELAGQIPTYGIITPQEKSLKECSFDKEADAVVLLDHAVTNYADDHSMVTVRRIRIKILKESALKRADIHIPFYSKNQFEFISDVKGFVYNYITAEQPEIIPLDRSSVYTEKQNDLYSVVKFAMPGARVGSILEYQYQSQMKSFSGLDEWSFQSDLPTLISHYDVTILPSVAFAYRVSKSPSLPIDLKYLEREGRLIMEMRNIAALRDEPFSVAPDDYRQKVIFQLAQYTTSYGSVQKYATNWEELNRDLIMNDFFYRVTEKNLSDAEDFVKKAKSIADPYIRMVQIHKFMQNNFTGNGYGSKFATNGLKKVWENKSGNTGELNLLFINLLKAAGLEAHPFLVSEHHHGKVNTSYPFEGQFNKVIANVIVDERNYFLDANDAYTPSDFIPLEILNTIGFRVHKKKPELIQLSGTEVGKKEYVGIMATISEEGLVKGSLSQSSSGYSRFSRLSRLARVKNEADYFDYYFRRKESDLKMTQLSLKNKEQDSLPLEQQFEFTYSAPENGGYLIADMNLFSDVPRSPFVSDIRFTDIHFDCTSNTVINAIYKIPATMKPESLPKNINLVMPDQSIQLLRTCTYDEANSQVISRVTIKYDKSDFKAAVYPSIKDFYKKMADMLNEPLVLRKK